MLNSDPVGTVVSGYIVDNHLSTHPVENIKLPKFDSGNPLHRKLSELSWEAHVAAAEGDDRAVRQFEHAIGDVVLGIWQ